MIGMHTNVDFLWELMDTGSDLPKRHSSDTSALIFKVKYRQTIM